MIIQPVEINQFSKLKLLYDSFDRPMDDWLDDEKCASILKSIRKQNGQIYVAILDDELVGTYAFYLCYNLTRSGKPFGVLENVVCSPKYRRQGIGKKLMKHAQVVAKEYGCYKLFIQTGAQRTENHLFYRSCGFSANKTGFEVRF